LATQHYYTRRRRGKGRSIVSDYLRGVTVEFYTSPAVFSAREIDEGTRLLIEAAIIPEEGLVLDMGCGYGVIGITLAKAYPRLRVVMVDVNPAAIELAKQNARLNNVEDRVEILQGNVYEPVKGMVFDAILSNPPLAAGGRVLEEIVLRAPSYLKDKGTLQLVVRKGAQKTLKLLHSAFSEVIVLARKKGYTVLMGRK